MDSEVDTVEKSGVGKTGKEIKSLAHVSIYQALGRYCAEKRALEQDEVMRFTKSQLETISNRKVIPAPVRKDSKFSLGLFILGTSLGMVGLEAQINGIPSNFHSLFDIQAPVMLAGVGGVLLGLGQLCLEGYSPINLVKNLYRDISEYRRLGRLE